MELIFRTSYNRDFRKISNKEVLSRLAAIFRQIENANRTEEIGGLKKLKEYSHYYRIKIKVSDRHDYRPVLMIRNNKVWAESMASVKKIFYKR